ncbi:flavonol 3-O-glucosyltransferase UGT89B1-like [Diospyros lotus]|uniref:flavonol 3-O-glucosyltransferase UGT89B1-like n=1 Tax=Diospyros lotus TaxID=55363 RepID=UPI00224CADDD|nr:flavonol 3-O-glucosyltransferase UGT89B1-like [Diospyros lotus]
MAANGDDAPVHVLLFPFPMGSHAVPMLDLAQLLLTRGLKVTVLVTPPNVPLVDSLRQSHPPSSIETLVLPPPEATPIPNLFRPVAFMNSLRKLHDPIRQWFQSHPSPPVAIVSDFFLGWTQYLAAELGVPRVVFWTGGAIDAALMNSMFRDLPKVDNPNDENSILSLPNLPNSPTYAWWQVSPIYQQYKEGDPNWEIKRNSMLGNIQCWGALINTFEELEKVYIDHLKGEMGHDRVWPVGPLLPPEDDKAGSAKRGGASSVPVEVLMSWLDEKREDSVVYVCFGSRFVLSDQQVASLAAALESSGVDFIWVVKEDEVRSMPGGFEDLVAGRGFVIKGWAPQVPILRHRAVGAFVTHCGWNSTMEAITAGVLLLTWPLGADQFTNAKLLVDELGAAVRFSEVGTRAVPDSGEMARLLKESVGAERAEERGRVKELSKAASEAPKGGSSSRSLDGFIQRLRELKNVKST